MKTLTITATAMILASVLSAHAGTYSEAMKTCGTEWRASDARKEVKKGEGMAAWQTFRKECVARVGYTSKRKGGAQS